MTSEVLGVCGENVASPEISEMGDHLVDLGDLRWDLQDLTSYRPGLMEDLLLRLALQDLPTNGCVVSTRKSFEVTPKSFYLRSPCLHPHAQVHVGPFVPPNPLKSTSLCWTTTLLQIVQIHVQTDVCNCACGFARFA